MSICSDVNTERKRLFAKKGQSIKGIPPTLAALEQHVKDALTKVVISGDRVLSRNVYCHYRVTGDG